MKLHIGNLPRSVSEVELREMIAPFARASSLEIVSDDEGVSKGYGIAEFATEDDAKAVIAAWDGRELGGHSLKVGEVKSGTTTRYGSGRISTTHLRVTTRASRELPARVTVTDTTVREAAARLLATSLVSSEISYVRRNLGSSATQEAIDAEVIGVRARSWSEIVVAEVEDRGTLRRRN